MDTQGKPPTIIAGRNFTIYLIFSCQVKIHPKMIYNRPPLNCQKCQFRFFTDQGLERHLLGSHGLVTASMQDAANKGQDSGRCPVCGKVEITPLLNNTDSVFSSHQSSGLPVEVVEPRSQGPRQDPEASPPLIQMHRLHSHVWSI